VELRENFDLAAAEADGEEVDRVFTLAGREWKLLPAGEISAARMMRIATSSDPLIGPAILVDSLDPTQRAEFTAMLEQGRQRNADGHVIWTPPTRQQISDAILWCIQTELGIPTTPSEQ
jgi:hypothetical protein